MSISTPSGLSYKVHGPFTPNKNAEIPHVHVMYQGRSASISLKDASFLIGADFFEQCQKQEILNWVSENLSALTKEWETIREERYNSKG